MEGFLSRAPDLSLNGVLLKVPKESLQGRMEIQHMKAKDICFLQTWLTQEVGAQGPDLNILPFFFLDGAPQKAEKFLPVFRPFDEWLTVVGERQRDHPAPCQPTAHAAQDQAVRQPGGWSGSRIDD